MKKILIFGSSGMLGHQLFNYLKSKKINVYGSVRNIKKNTNKNIIKVDVRKIEKVKKIIYRINPDLVVNCSGIVKKNINSIYDLYEVNSLFPMKLNLLSIKNNFKLIHISTDCVFSGDRGNYNENDIPDASDHYGYSKLFGEVTSKNSLTIRTSIIGKEMNGNNRGLLEWFLSQKSHKINGYTKAFFSGVTTLELSKIIFMLIKSSKSVFFNQILHISGPKISKYRLLELFKKKFYKNITINRKGRFKIDRSLNSNKFIKLTKYKKKAWSKMINELVINDYENV